MTNVKFTYLFGVILYTTLAVFTASHFEIYWIHILNSLLLSSIFYNLLDFKFSCQEEE